MGENHMPDSDDPHHRKAGLMADVQTLKRELVEKRRKLAGYESDMMGKMDERGLDITRFEIEHLQHDIHDIEGALVRQQAEPSDLPISAKNSNERTTENLMN
jgi:hypothetical protein